MSRTNAHSRRAISGCKTHRRKKPDFTPRNQMEERILVVPGERVQVINDVLNSGEIRFHCHNLEHERRRHDAQL
jgi:FtsP/CotA-like multicopper oxidase with cupredoxin domain